MAGERYIIVCSMNQCSAPSTSTSILSIGGEQRKKEGEKERKKESQERERRKQAVASFYPLLGCMVGWMVGWREGGKLWYTAPSENLCVTLICACVSGTSNSSCLTGISTNNEVALVEKKSIEKTKAKNLQLFPMKVQKSCSITQSNLRTNKEAASRLAAMILKLLVKCLTNCPKLANTYPAY